MKKTLPKKAPKFFDYNVYVACSLTHAPKEFRDEVDIFKDKLGLICNVVDFGCLGDKPPHEVYRWDIQECVNKSDLVFAICDFPAIGLGYEIATQVEVRKKPCIAVAHDKSLVTSLILDTRQPGFEFKRYKNLRKDGLKIVKDKLQKMCVADTVNKMKQTRQLKRAKVKVK